MCSCRCSFELICNENKILVTFIVVIICSRLNFYETIKREVNKRLTHMSVGVMKDEKLNLRVLHVSDTLKVYYE